jgi:ankyrin repeat protein
MIAARARHQQLSKYLIEQHNVDVNASDNSGRQALCEAARCGHTAMIRLLFQTGKVRTTNKSRSDWRCPVTKTPSPLADFRTPLARAAEGGHLPAVELLLAVSSTEPDSVDLYGYTPLGLAAKGGHLKVIARLLKTGKVDVNMQNRAGESPLLLAVKSGLSLPVETLLLANADVNLADTSDRTPLLWAIRIGNFSAITQLIATSRCNVSAADRSGLTALHYAAAVGRVVALPSLRQYHIDTESKDMNGETPLVWAVRARQLGSVRELLRLARSSNIGDSQVSKHFLEWLLSKDEDDESVLNILTEILLKSKKEAVDEPLPLQTGIGDVRQLWAGVVAVSWFPRELVY